MTGGMFTVVCVPFGQVAGRDSVARCSIAGLVFLAFFMTTSAHVEVDGMFSRGTVRFRFGQFWYWCPESLHGQKLEGCQT
jgi:hypothetical protein